MKQIEQFLEKANLVEVIKGQSRQSLRTVPCLALRLENGENAVGARRAHALRSEKLQPDPMSDATIMLAAIETGDSPLRRTFFRGLAAERN
jgi:hypothetical protein